MCLCVFVCSPVAPLWKTLQDVVAEAELVFSLTAVNTLQSYTHQLVWVPNNLLLALAQTHTHTRVIINISSVKCISSAVQYHQGCNISPYCVTESSHNMFVSRCCNCECKSVWLFVGDCICVCTCVCVCVCVCVLTSSVYSSQETCP